jgi:hypothetical protein
MLTVFAAATMAMQPAAATAGVSTDPDTHCLTAYLVAAGNMGEDATATAEDKAGVQSIVMYFVGKLYARSPRLDLKGEIDRLLHAPGYLQNGLKPDIERCSVEAMERGKYLESFGDDPQKAPPAATNRPG